MIGKTVQRALALQQQSLIKVPSRSIYPHMSSNHVAGMPRNRIAFAEKVGTGVFFFVGILATPAWIISHLSDYRGH